MTECCIVLYEKVIIYERGNSIALLCINNFFGRVHIGGVDMSEELEFLVNVRFCPDFCGKQFFMYETTDRLYDETKGRSSHLVTIDCVYLDHVIVDKKRYDYAGQLNKQDVFYRRGKR